MPTKLFVNLPVKDLSRSKAFFTDLGLAFFGRPRTWPRSSSASTLKSCC